MSLTMFDKIWARHVVAEGPGGHTLLYIDRHLLHEGSAAAFARLARGGHHVRWADLCAATGGHSVLTPPGADPGPKDEGSGHMQAMSERTLELLLSRVVDDRLREIFLDVLNVFLFFLQIFGRRRD